MGALSWLMNLGFAGGSSGEPVAPSVPGAEWEHPGERAHWQADSDRAHWKTDGDRLHWTHGEE